MFNKVKQFSKILKNLKTFKYPRLKIFKELPNFSAIFYSLQVFDGVIPDTLGMSLRVPNLHVPNPNPKKDMIAFRILKQIILLFEEMRFSYLKNVGKI